MSDTLQQESSTPRTVTEIRSYERLIVGIHTGVVRLDIRDYRYRHAVNGTDMDDVMFDAEDRGWVHLAPGQPPKVTDVGMQWLSDRYARLGVAPTRPGFMLPALPPPTPAAPKRTRSRNARRAGRTPIARTEAGRARMAHLGERNPRARLTEAQVRDIRARLATGTSRNSLAAEYQVDKATITDIKNRATWRHVA